MSTSRPGGNSPAPAMNGTDSETLRRAVALVNAVRDPALPGMLLGAGLAVGGFAMVTVAWLGVSGTLLVPLQTPYLLSGGLGGIALTAVGALVIAIQGERRDQVIANLDMKLLAREVGDVVDIAIASHRARADQPIDPGPGERDADGGVDEDFRR